ncbi:MAG TPA: hypothetical protein VLH19_03080, partial [Patescibacteria group bacterium]|nr:hypothetical protein [Patescibacteria group bacterium]
MIESMLTTIDNPHDPFTDYESWLAFDMISQHNSAGFLARVVVLSDELSLADQRRAIDEAIDEIVEENVTGMYKKVSREVPDPPDVVEF